MSGDRHIARRFASLDEDTAVRQCLTELFTFEFENADARSVAYNAKYEQLIARYSKQWNAPSHGEAPQ